MVRFELITVSLALTLCLSMTLFPRSAKVLAGQNPRVIFVPDDFGTIQAAVNDAGDGDTVFVHNGTYYEHIVVNKSISLVGEHRYGVIVDGSSYGAVFNVSVNAVSIHNFTVLSSGNLSTGLYVGSSMGFIFGCCITDCTIRAASGVSLRFSYNGLVAHNDVSSSSYDGVSLTLSGNNSLLYNTISDNGLNGLSLLSSHNNIVSHNNISDNFWTGLSLQSSSNNLVFGNGFTDNRYGVTVDSSTNNSVYHNNIASDVNAVIMTPQTVNAWDHEGEGNSWSNYTGSDLNDDGLGDTPHYINKPGGAHDQDNYPLMGRYSHFTIDFQGKTHDTYVVSDSTISSFRFELGVETANRLIRFSVINPPATAGFCRIAIPLELMPAPHIILIDSKEVIPRSFNSSDTEHARLYFTYQNRNQTITIIYSEVLHLYYGLLDSFLALQMNLTKLQSDYGMLNDTYYTLLESFALVQQNLTALSISYSALWNLSDQLNVSYAVLQASYNALLVTLGQLQSSFAALNTSYTMLAVLNSSHYGLLHDYSLLVADYSLLHTRFAELNASYQSYIQGYSQDYQKQTQNLRNLLYVFASTTTLFVITTVYLSKRAHASKTTKTKRE